jgi:hypothetical protein
MSGAMAAHGFVPAARQMALLAEIDLLYPADASSTERSSGSAGAAAKTRPVHKAIVAGHQAVRAMGSPRLFPAVKINTRTDNNQGLEGKGASVTHPL